jgi:hypothetical protein
MNITLKDLGQVSDGEKRKFILVEDGRLLYGICKWHKDLGNAEAIGDLKVVGAGVIPLSLKYASDEEWGDWQSTGYGIVTPEELRNPIKEALSVAFS